MFRQSLFHRRQITLARLVLFALLLIVALMMRVGPQRGLAAMHAPLTFEDRVAVQRAIEKVYWRHRIWPKENPQPKPPLSEVMPDAAIRAKVEDYLRKSTALEVYWQRPLTPDQLQAEMERMARQSKQPEVLGELWAALGNDPLLIAECLARPLLADRLLRERYAADERFHGESRRRAEAELNWPDAAHRLREMSGEYREVEWRLVEDAAQHEVTARDGVVALQPAEWRARMEQLRRMFDSAPDGVQSTAFRRKGLVNEPPPEGGTPNAVSPRLLPLGQVSALQEDEERRYAAAVLEQSAQRVKLAVVEWRKAPFDEWWGRVKGEMAMDVVAASDEYRLPEIEAQPSSCFTDAWRFTSQTGAPSARERHTAVWTGSEMIVWGGSTDSGRFNTGGRYNPATNTWSATNTADAPSARLRHTAVWTGSEMIVWGGEGINSNFNTGGRYNPASDTWGATNTTGAPASRAYHTAVWTGSVMIIWGGFAATGGRYNPTINMWTATSTTGAPTARGFAIGSHGAIWTGREMIIWGGRVDLDNRSNRPNDGGRYDPATDAWTATNTAGAPTARDLHTAVWTGSEMIVWGGTDASIFSTATGGRYNPTTNTWAATSTTGTPGERAAHTAVWTGSEMIVWGGSPIFDPPRGGRYNPMTDTWLATGTANAPQGRDVPTAVWTGNAMIVWGGRSFSIFHSSGGIYSLTSSLTLSPTTQSFSATGGTGTISVTSPSSCTWTATSNTTWLTITSGASGAGSGTVNFAVAANTTGSPRTGTLTIGPQTFTVNQTGDNPVPMLTGLNPNSAVAGGQGFTLTVTGANFVNGATVRWNGNNRTTTFTNATQLTAAIPATDIAAAGAASVTVFNPAPGSGVSNAMNFAVNSALANVSAASFLGAELAPESIVAAFGTGLATQTVVATDADPNTPGIQLPTELAGTTVEVKDSAGTTRRAPLFFVSPTQVNYLMPSLTAPGACVVTIKSGDGKIAVGTVQAASVAPGLFTANASGQGVAAGVVLRVRGNNQSFEPIAEFDPAQNKFVAKPIDLGPEGDQVFLILYGVGFRFRSALSAVSVKIGGAEMEVLYAAEAPGFIGLDQSNVRLSRSLMGRGEVDVVLMVEGKAANMVRIVIK